MKLIFLLLWLWALTGCSAFSPVKDSAVHHLLSPLVADRPLMKNGPSIAINRPSLPAYLDREQLVTRDAGQLLISNLNLWAEPLDAAIARVTASNLSRLTGSTNIQPLGSFVTLDYTLLLELRIHRFEVDGFDQMTLEGTWKLQPVKGGEATNHFYRIRKSIAPSATPASARVEAMNQCLFDLAQLIFRRF